VLRNPNEFSMNFADPRSDIAFKKIFGSQERSHILISFLNAALGFSGERSIASLVILNPYQAPKIKGLKESNLDVKAKDQAGREFIVEMQVERDIHFTKRAVYYSAKAYTQQLGKSLKYDTLNPVYFLGILDFSIFEGAEPISRHLILNEKTRNQDIKELEFNFIELDKFDKTEKQLKTIVDKWLFFLKNTSQLDAVPKALKSEPEIDEAFEIANQHNWTLAEIDYYEKSEMKRYASILNLEQGIEKGIQKGIQEATATLQNELNQEHGLRLQAEADKHKAEADKLRIALSSAEMLRTAQMPEDRIRQTTGIDFAQLEAWIRSGRP